ncbi:MAG: glycosyltransferase family 2 protein, partial [Saprospiraceae bacterium]|nr:glycosyltransferase family 2 protein [Saprospiraceae bacterium]
MTSRTLCLENRLIALFPCSNLFLSIILISAGGRLESNPLHIDLVIPVYNEMDGIQIFHHVLSSAVENLPYAFQIYYINDGSLDRTAEILEEIARVDHRVVIVELSRNFGHQAALTAGLDLANGDYVISLDGDGQHPPERIGEMVQVAVQQNYDIVIMQRIAEISPNSFAKRISWKNKTSDLFYQLINRIGDTRIVPGAADFRLMSHAAVLALRSMPEYSRFLRGMVNWMGFHTLILPYDQSPRLAGRSKYTLPKMLHL